MVPARPREATRGHGMRAAVAIKSPEMRDRVIENPPCIHEWTYITEDPIESVPNQIKTMQTKTSEPLRFFVPFGRSRWCSRRGTPRGRSGTRRSGQCQPYESPEPECGLRGGLVTAVRKAYRPGRLARPRRPGSGVADPRAREAH